MYNISDRVQIHHSTTRNVARTASSVGFSGRHVYGLPADAPGRDRDRAHAPCMHTLTASTRRALSLALAGCAGGNSAAGRSEGEAEAPAGHLVPVAPPTPANHRDRALPWWWKAHVHADRGAVGSYTSAPVDAVGVADVLADVDTSTRARHG